MAKLYFHYGPVRAGKTTELLRIADNYSRQGKKTMLLKPKMDTRDEGVVSRLGLKLPVDLRLDPELENFSERFIPKGVACVLVDEAQFCSRENIHGLRMLTTKRDIPVMCFGIRADYRGTLFPGSAALFAIADALKETKTTCWVPGCDRKATFNAKCDEHDQLIKLTATQKSVNRAGNKYRDLNKAEVEVGHHFIAVCHQHWPGA